MTPEETALLKMLRQHLTVRVRTEIETVSFSDERRLRVEVEIRFDDEPIDCDSDYVSLPTDK
jgi:hypothetical protein